MKPGADTRAAIRWAAFLFAIGLCLLGISCGNPPTIWKAEARSPDGLWIASAQTIQNGGFGLASIDTVVYLRRTNRSEPPTEVLGLSCHGPAPRPYVLDKANAGGTIDLTMKWVTPFHLEVTYDNHPDLYFQVVKIGGIDISALDLSSKKDKASR
jgi:hypothetical protein